jgi:hypothetical protein
MPCELRQGLYAESPTALSRTGESFPVGEVPNGECSELSRSVTTALVNFQNRPTLQAKGYLTIKHP